MRSPGARGRFVALLLAALIAPGCSPQADGSGTKAGDPATVTLRMADAYANLDQEPAVAAFVDEVERRSHGLLRIEVTHVVGDFQPDFEEQVVHAVASGEFDLAWVGTRAFDAMGVRSFAALTAPLLVDSYALQEEVLRSELPDQMLAGLDGLGVQGLALLAGGLRRPMAVAGPLLSPEDWRGITFAAVRSEGQAATVRALGATPTDVIAGDLDRALHRGEVDGFEKNLLIYSINGLADVAPHVTADVALWPETAVLLADPHRLDRLSTEQAQWLRDAAEDAAGRSAQLVDVDQSLIDHLCARGARFATASPSDLAALQAAVAPVYAQLAGDPATTSAIARIRELKQAVPEAAALQIPPGCTDPV
jgi:TRAP-type C4-dicarboxylate transport system substrate-binding protein